MNTLVFSCLDEAFILAGNVDNYKSLNEFELLSDPITHY